MATNNPKLEFFKFKLNHHKGERKTFRDYAVEELNANKNASNEDIFKLCFTQIMKQLDEDYAKDDKRQKAITLVSDETRNEYLDKKPSMLSSKSIIHGVINGGTYGKKRILSDINDKKQVSGLGKSQTVLMYHYIFIYLPPEHHEGFFMVHSNGTDENVTSIFRDYIAKIFQKAGKYNKPTMEVFAPKKFQDDYRNGATIKSLTFNTTIIDTLPSTMGFKDVFDAFEISIKAVPKTKKGKKIPTTKADSLIGYLSKHIFKTQKAEVELQEFRSKKVEVQSDASNSPKMFEFQDLDKAFTPAVQLKNRPEVKLLDDQTPDMDSLKTFCLNLFETEILKEIRPDLNASRA